MRDLIVVGLGQALQAHYAKTLADMRNVFRITGLIDPDVRKDALIAAVGNPSFNDAVHEAHWVPYVNQAGLLINTLNTTALVLTPDHFQTINALAEWGITEMIVEKPIVSRDREVEKLKRLIAEYELKVYAIDFYIPKLFPLQMLTGRIGHDDPRFLWVRSSLGGSHAFPWNAIDGIAVQILEGGSFCLPDLKKRPWLENDIEIGGMLRDLGTHALAPLIACGLLDTDAEVHMSALSKITSDRRSLRPCNHGEIEMHAHFELTQSGVPVSVTLGKVPFEHSGNWSLSIRGADHEMFYAGLRTGQPSVLIKKEGQVRFDLVKSTYELVLEEALLYFDGKLRGFDGNVGALFGSLDILRRVRERYHNL